MGDAGYFKDPLTAHGITDALIDAELLAQAAAAGTEAAFAGYQNARDKLAVGHFEVTDAVASFEWDLPKVRQLHRALSDEMKKESLAVASGGADNTPRREMSTSRIYSGDCRFRTARNTVVRGANRTSEAMTRLRSPVTATRLFACHAS